MPHFAIIRTDKHTSDSSIGRTLSHTFRDRPTPNADPSKKNALLIGAGTSAGVKAALKSRLVEVGLEEAPKKKPDRVRLIEYLVTASPEWFKEHGGSGDMRAYFSKAVAWLEQRHGKGNVLSAVAHLDETTPHLVAHVVPLVHRPADTVQRSVNAKGGGRKVIDVARPARWELTAAAFQGLPAQLVQLQTDFASQVGKAFGLVRGVHKSKAKHTSIRAYYGGLELGAKRMPDGPPALTAADHAKAAVGIETPAVRKHRAWTADATRAVVGHRAMKPGLDAQAGGLAKREKALAAREAEAQAAAADAAAAKADAQQTRQLAAKRSALVLKNAWSMPALCERLGLKAKGKADVFELMLKGYEARGTPKTFAEVVSEVERRAPPEHGDRWLRLSAAADEHSEAYEAPPAARSAAGQLRTRAGQYERPRPR